MHRIAAPSIRESQGRATLVFCVTCDYAERLAEILRRYPGVTAETVLGTTPADVRADRVARFKNNQLQMLVVVGCATEGFDAPNVEVIVVARPTKKKGLYVQMIGRGTRPLPGIVERYDTPELRQKAIKNSAKTRVLILDFVGNSGKHKLISTADVLAGHLPPDLVAAAVADMKETGESDDICNAVWKQKQKRDEEERKVEEERLRVLAERQAADEARRSKLKADAEYRKIRVDPFGKAQVPECVQPAFRGGCSNAQVRLLVAYGYKEEAAMQMSKGQAGKIIGEKKAFKGGDWIMCFGKHSGKHLRQIPFDYLRWAGENIQRGDFQDNLELFREEFRKCK